MSLLQLGQESDKLRARNRDAVALLMQLVSDGRDQEILGGSSRVPGGCWTPNLQLLWGSEPSPHSRLPSGGLDVGAAHPPALDWYSGSAGPAKQFKCKCFNLWLGLRSIRGGSTQLCLYGGKRRN